jgi:hypothetical protein
MAISLGNVEASAMPQTPGEVNEIRGRAGRVFRKTLQGGGKKKFFQKIFSRLGAPGKFFGKNFPRLSGRP